MRVTVAVATVLQSFLADPTEERYGYDLMRQCRMGSSKLYPILDRLEKAGWLHRAREALDPVVAGRPPRVLYRLTAEGQRAARLELAALTEQLRVSAKSRSGLRPQWGGAR